MQLHLFGKKQAKVDLETYQPLNLKVEVRKVKQIMTKLINSREVLYGIDLF